MILINLLYCRRERNPWESLIWNIWKLLTKIRGTLDAIRTYSFSSHLISFQFFPITNNKNNNQGNIFREEGILSPKEDRIYLIRRLCKDCQRLAGQVEAGNSSNRFDDIIQKYMSIDIGKTSVELLLLVCIP